MPPSGHLWVSAQRLGMCLHTDFIDLHGPCSPLLGTVPPQDSSAPGPTAPPHTPRACWLLSSPANTSTRQGLQHTVGH